MTWTGTWRAGMSHYVNIPPEGSESAVGQRFNGRLYRSCESVEATPRRKVNAFLAFPAVCAELELCELRAACIANLRRDLVVYNARWAVRSARTGA
jgi:hypothetical protein